MDVLVEVQQGHVPGFKSLHKIEAELSTLLGGRKVDLVTRKSLNHRIRDQVTASAETLYQAA